MNILNIAVTGAAGQIGYSLIPMVYIQYLDLQWIRIWTKYQN